MKPMSFFFVVILFLTIFLSCKKEDVKEKSTSENKILILGASRVEGNRPEYESFRYELWKRLITDTLNFDFIGTRTDEKSYPNYIGNKFDSDHEGRGGWTSEQIEENLEDWLNQTGAPDIVIFSTPGGNDALENLPYSNTISHINKIIDIIQVSNTNCTIIIELPAPGHTSIMTGNLATYLENLQTDLTGIATNQTNNTSAVLTVNMYTGFSNSMLADDVHYNEYGAKFIADKHFEVLKEIIK